ncbi:MAG: cation:proton antiporter, partial [Ignavibacteria bacterium]
NLIGDLALILAAAGLVTLIFKKLKQPLVLGYIIAGFIVGPNFSLFPSISDVESIKTWAEIGVIFLLFGLGLEFSFKKLIKVGAASSITAVFEIVFMFAAGYFTGQMFGWNIMTSVFLGGILSISSTTIIIRAFDELGLKSRKFVTLVFGVLIVEDLVAIFLLVLLSTLALSQQFQGGEILISVLKLFFFLALWFAGGIFLIPTFLKATRKLMNDETMLIVALGLCLAMVFLAIEAGFSAALGAFIMGSILAETTNAERIEHLIKPVKDLFGAIFFISVGMLIDPVMIKIYLVPIILISVITIFGKSFSTTAGALISGQSLKHSLRAGMSLAQIGEFSFIIATLGLTLKVTDDFLYPIAVAVSAVTTFTTPYLIKLADPIYNVLEKILPVKLVKYLNRYSSAAENIKTESAWKKIIKTFVVTVVINSVVIAALMLLSFQFILPFIDLKIDSDFWGDAITAFTTLVIISPFLWGLAGKPLYNEAFNNLIIKKKHSRGPFILLEVFRIILAIFFISFLFYRVFLSGLELLLAIPVLIIVTYIFSGRLKTFYNKMESKFLENLNARENGTISNPASELLPWDAHLAEFFIYPESSLAGKTLSELNIREDYGINIASIERGKNRINIPTKEERIFPGDILSVIGTDEELDKFRTVLKISENEFTDTVKGSEIYLQQFTIDNDTRLNGRSIQETGIHDKLNSLVIGIERNGERILNPESNVKFEEGDLVWVAGEKNIYKKIIGNNNDKVK